MGHTPNNPPTLILVLGLENVLFFLLLYKYWGVLGSPQLDFIYFLLFIFINNILYKSNLTHPIYPLTDIVIKIHLTLYFCYWFKVLGGLATNSPSIPPTNPPLKRKNEKMKK